ncbi:Wzz/FepE/Etk N-terminal domain-containing protein [Streptomyces sp. BH055]|uniref:Wzz/FepE/Etk N-terminal domain-containing protein n=1 Tax=Streptomyces sp. BH055 TaxID=3401173 RepID=UPI003BB55436
MTTNGTSESAAGTPLLDLHALVVAVRRRRRLWGALALLGLVIGAAVAIMLPPPPSAVTKVLVAHQEDQPNDTGTLIRTDIEVLGTTRIAKDALQTLKSRENPADFMQDYRGTGLTNNVLQIDVSADSEALAVDRAKALADAFVADHVRRMRAAAKAESQALLDQRDRMREELARVNKEIGDRAPDGSADESAAGTETLFARRAELNSRIADFDQRAAEARTGTPKVVAGTQIVDAPRAVRHSLPKTTATNAAIGLILGLVLGLALSAVGAVVADRPVLRRDISANLGASVIAELPRRSRLWRRKGTRATRERLTATLARTVHDSAEPLSLLELGCARSTSAIALDLAGALAAEGPVAVIDGLPGPQLADHRPQQGGPRVVSSEHAASLSPQDRRIGVGSVAPGTAWTDLQYLGTQTVLVVRAGHGSAAWLHTVARQLAEQRIPVLGVVLIDPDPRDRTDGTLWDGLHTALRGRGERPARHNGSGPRRTERKPAWAARGADNDQEAR